MTQRERLERFTYDKMDLQLQIEEEAEADLAEIDLAELMKNPVQYMRDFFVQNGLALVQAQAQRAKALGEHLAGSV